MGQSNTFGGRSDFLDFATHGNCYAYIFDCMLFPITNVINRVWVKHIVIRLNISRNSVVLHRTLNE